MTDFSVLRSRRTGTLITADDIDYTVGVGFQSRQSSPLLFLEVP
jgi:hypothetical protein